MRQKELLCDCGAHARFVPKGYGFVWKCLKCETWAKADEDGYPVEGLAKDGLRQARERIAKQLKEQGMAPADLGAKMGLRPWNVKIPFFTIEQCEKAREILNPKKEEYVPWHHQKKGGKKKVKKNVVSQK